MIKVAREAKEEVAVAKLFQLNGSRLDFVGTTISQPGSIFVPCPT